MMGANEVQQRTTARSTRGLNAWCERHAGWLTLLSAVALAVTIAVSVRFSEGPQGPWLWPSLLALGGFLMAAILLFTRPLIVESDVSSLFRFAWGFAGVIALSGLLTMYFGFDSHVRAPTEAPKEGGLYREQRLIAIVPGCDYSAVAFENRPKPVAAPAVISTAAATEQRTAGPENRPGMPEGAYCGELPPQWVVSIGGSILACHFDGTCPRRLSRPDLAELEALSADAHSRLAVARARLDRAKKELRKHEDLVAINSAWAESQPAGTKLADEQREAAEVASLTKQSTEARARLDSANKWSEHNRNIVGSPIIGGVIVPVYFVAIAILGALVNLTRKLPEFQQRVDSTYPEEFATRTAAGEGPLPPVSWPYARDLVVFQILQVLTAPAVALLAYSWVTPQEVSTGVILAFAAGFTSEVFLVAVRAVVDRTIGLGPRAALARAVLPVQPQHDSLLRRGQPAAAVASKFKAGEAIVLVKPVGAFRPGTTGVVLSVEPGDELIVCTMTDHTGMPVRVRLQSQPSESFDHAGAATAASGGPEG